MIVELLCAINLSELFLLELVLYDPVNNVSVILKSFPGRVEPVFSTEYKMSCSRTQHGANVGI